MTSPIAPDGPATLLVLLSKRSPLLERVPGPVNVQAEVSRVTHGLPEHHQVEAAVEQRANVVAARGKRALQRSRFRRAVFAAGETAEAIAAGGIAAFATNARFSCPESSLSAETEAVAVRR